MNEAEPEMVKERIRANAYSLIIFDDAWMAEGETMRKQILRGLTTLLGIMTLAMVTAVTTANGQSVSARANIPFAFEVSNRNMPAGAYTLNSISAGGETLRIKSDDSKNVALGLTRVADGRAKHAQLVFHRYGQRYFLVEVWGNANEGRELSTSSRERAIQKEMSRIAANKPAGRSFEIVALAIVAQ